MAKKRKEEELDTETTFADMNVEGFSWYDPAKKKGRQSIGKLSRKEYRAMVRGAFEALLPVILGVVAIGLLLMLFAVLWLK